MSLSDYVSSKLTKVATSEWRHKTSHKSHLLAISTMAVGIGVMVMLSLLVEWVGSRPTHFYWDYIVIGAGPGGLQLGYFLQQAGRNYVLLEKANTSGSFFTKFPRHDKLISINKRNTRQTNKEFNFRHDWNSLISHDESLQLRHYSKKLFPHRKTLVKYLTDYKEKLGIQVRYNTHVSDVKKVKPGQNRRGLFVMKDQHDNVYSCKTLVLANGLGKVNKPKFKGDEFTESCEDVSLDPDDYEGKSVLILGIGNSAFELADSIYGATNVIHMLARSRVRLSWSTHYVGDLRAVNNALLDTYQLKSLDGLLEGPVEEIIVKQVGNKYELKFTRSQPRDNAASRDGYDCIIQCLGWRYDQSIMHRMRLLETPDSKYPTITRSYEARFIPGLYFAGANTHSLDYRVSAGGFIHGFRYTAKVLHRLLEWKNHKVPWPGLAHTVDQLVPIILKRVNECSGPYQMFSTLGDLIALNNDGETFELYDEFPLKLIYDFPKKTGRKVHQVIIISYEYGANFSGPGKDTFYSGRDVSSSEEAHLSNFLHPVLYYYNQLPSKDDIENAKWDHVLPRPDRLHVMLEDFLTLWTSPISHILPLRRFIENIYNQDFRHFFAEDCMKMALTFQRLPHMCEQHFLAGQGILGTEKLLTEADNAGLLLAID